VRRALPRAGTVVVARGAVDEALQSGRHGAPNIDQSVNECQGAGAQRARRSNRQRDRSDGSSVLSGGTYVISASPISITTMNGSTERVTSLKL